MKFLIVNADDFGLAPEINAAVVRAHQNGILTGASLMTAGEAFDEAVAAAEELPQLGIGIHTTLVGGLRPTAPAEEVPSLLTPEGRLYESYNDFLRADLAGKIDYSEVATELAAQFEKIVATGLHITHADGHQHLHIWPRVLPIVVTLCQKHHIGAIRIPQENWRYGKLLANPGRFGGKAGLAVLAARARRYVRRFGLQTTDAFWGMMDGGKLTERRLLAIIRELGDGFHEIMCHPGTDTAALQHRFGWDYAWERELQALTSPAVYEELMKRNVHRISFGDLR
ncbi:MAG: ChbG/HpnK family deacetylase [Veillonellaceae bacterium]|nr:ChbG/HpnK family deacetylase [Veillonellaceae bacterium]